MHAYRRNLMFLTLLVLMAAGGAGCPGMVRPYSNLPRVLPQQPSLEQIISTVNQNSARIQSFSTNRATITISGSPTLRANVAMQRPARFRLQADTALTAGPEFDLGSNDERFWFWYRGDPQRAYFCRHDQFAASAARANIPIAPGELFDALGLAEFDPTLSHQEPNLRPDGRFEIRTTRETAEGPTTKVTVVDPAGWVAEQHFFDARGQLALSTYAWAPRRDPLSGLVMPTMVKVDCKMTGFVMQINLGNVEINTIMADRPDLWTMPLYDGAQLVDLADPNLQFNTMGPPPSQPMGNAPAAQRILHQRMR